MLLFDVQWVKVIMIGLNVTIHKDVLGILEVDSTNLWNDLRDTFVLPKHCEQVCF